MEAEAADFASQVFFGLRARPFGVASRAWPTLEALLFDMQIDEVNRTDYEPAREQPKGVLPRKMNLKYEAEGEQHVEDPARPGERPPATGGPLQPVKFFPGFAVG